MSGENSAFDLLHKNIQQWIYKNGWEELRPAQVESIKEIRQTSNHLIICSPTASGKTEAAMLPLISELLEKNIYEKSYIIYISPLKALINDRSYLDINLSPKLLKSFPPSPLTASVTRVPAISLGNNIPVG